MLDPLDPESGSVGAGNHIQSDYSVLANLELTM